MQINEAQKKVHKWIDTYGGGYFDILTNIEKLIICTSTS